MQRLSAILNLRISDFCHFSVARVKICVCIPNFVQIGPFAAEIWRYNDFQMAAVRHVKFSILEFSSSNLRMRAIVPPSTKFRLNQTTWSRVIVKNDLQYGVRPRLANSELGHSGTPFTPHPPSPPPSFPFPWGPTP